jgi:hypothetical protein
VEKCVVVVVVVVAVGGPFDLRDPKGRWVWTVLGWLLGRTPPSSFLRAKASAIHLSSSNSVLPLFPPASQSSRIGMRHPKIDAGLGLDPGLTKRLLFFL